MSKKLRDIGVVSFLTSVSRVLGLLRDQLALGILGASGINDAFVTAFNLPNLFRRLLGEGALTAAFVPTMQQELNERGREGAFALVSQVVSWLAVITGGLVAVAMAVFSQSRLLPGHDGKWYLAADLTAVLFPYLAFVCLAAACGAALNVLGRFTEAALSPVWLNLCMIASLAGAGWLWHAGDGTVAAWLCGGVLAGGFFQMIVPAAALMREGWRPRFDLGRSERVREIARLMAPGLFGTAIYQVNVFVSRLFAFSIEPGEASLFFYSNRLMELPIGVFAIAVSTVVYPLLARHVAEKDFVAMAADYRRGVRLILLLNVPAAVGLAVLSTPIVRLLYERGKFTSADTATMAPLLALFAIGMPFFAVASLMTRAFYATKDTVTPVKLAALSFVINVALGWWLKDHLGARGLVVASTAAVVVQTVLLQRLLGTALPGMQFGELWQSLGKILLATAVMAVVVGGGWLWLGRALPRAEWLAVFALIPLGMAVYGAALWALKIDGRDELAALWTRVRGAKR
ncbi:MAG: murein biosynthesis integral membrane protein MurJ [Verrucomicrobia bacterium]|nr:murein biosynthesis integral membrane protein MurJ [Verrucomicrobiota bacterium]